MFNKEVAIQKTKEIIQNLEKEYKQYSDEYNEADEDDGDYCKFLERGLERTSTKLQIQRLYLEELQKKN